ncbi:hypothetical protein Hanom_Chr15g01353351 [Helianthus anomalus]
MKQTFLIHLTFIIVYKNIHNFHSLKTKFRLICTFVCHQTHPKKLQSSKNRFTINKLMKNMFKM